MSASRTILQQSEAAALAAIEALLAEQPSTALVELTEALTADHPGDDFDRMFRGFALTREEGALLLLLLAHAGSLAVARALQLLSPASAGHGLPVWLASELVPGINPASFGWARALRRFALVDLEPAVIRIEGHVRLDDAVLDRLLGQRPRPTELSARIRPLVPAGGTGDSRIGEALRDALTHRDRGQLSHAVLFEAEEPAGIARSLADLGLRAHLLPSSAIPVDPTAAERLASEWSREAMLDAAALVILAEESEAARAAEFASRVLGHVCLVGHVRPAALQRGCRVVPAQPAGPIGLIERWAAALGPDRTTKLGRHVARVAMQFRLDPDEIDELCRREASALDRAEDGDEGGARLWHAAGRAAPSIAVAGVSIIEPVFRWDDLVLAPAVEQALRRLETHVRHATTVMDDWGFARGFGGRGRGVVALLAGPSGTGKTMAAEVLASSLDLRMMVIDLSQVISKFVGETSKNIAACFRHAERSGAVMVWNEGDAIWGARGSVGNATDRHVNAETGDLLQRMEGFNGFSVVTTNLRHAVDTAFLRRFRFMIDFPMPSEAERLRIWQKAFPREAPVDELDWSALSGLPLSGGSIRNVALGSAFHVAERGGRIDAEAISAELAAELRKQNLPMPVLEWGTRQ